MSRYFVTLPVLALLVGCNAVPTADRASAPRLDVLGFEPDATTTQYTRPEASGLRGVRAYPGVRDVCQIIGENAATAPLLDDATVLVGCPKHEAGAIAARMSEGASVVAHARHWTLFAVPR